MRRFLVVSLFAISYLLFATRVTADVSCQPIYGGGQTCQQTGNLLLTKTILNPQTNTMVANLGVNDPKYSPDFITTFQLTVKNTGSGTISHVDIKDVFPQFVNFTVGPGSFDQNTKTVSFGLDNLNPGESRLFTILGKVVSANQLPGDKSVVCVVNQATATTADGLMSQSNSQFCIQKVTITPTPVPTTKGGLKVFPQPQVTTTPPTGPEMLPLIGLIPTGILGAFLRRKTKLSSKGGEK